MKILYVSPINLKDPKRGTPIRIVNLLKQIRKTHELVISCASVDDEFRDIFIPYPFLGWLAKSRFFLKIIRLKGIQIVMTSGEANIKLPIILKFLTGVKIANDLHGVPGEEEYLAGLMSKSGKILYQLKIKFLMRFYDHLFPVSRRLKDYFGAKKATIIYGGVNMDEYPILPGGSDSKDFTIGYMGNFRNYQGLELLFEVAQKIKAKRLFPFRLRLVINSDIELVNQKLNELNLTDSTDLLVNVPHDQANKSIAGSDALIIPRPKIPVTELAYPTKLPEFLATSIPVITTEVGPVKELLEGTGACLIVPAKNIVDNLTDAITRLQAMPKNEREILGLKGRHFVQKHLTWDTIGETLNESLKKI